MLVFGAELHLGQAVADIRGVQFIDPDRLWIVGLNRYHGHAPVLVVRGQPPETLFIHLRDRAMITGEDYNQDWTRRIIAQLVRLSIHAG